MSQPALSGDTEYRSACEQAALFDVSDRGKIELTGPEAASFLHNLCTNDILNLPPGHGCEAFLATAKARLVAPLLVSHVCAADGEDAYWLDVPAALTEKVLQHLDHYRISEQVEFLDHSGEYAQLHLAGPRAGALIGDPPLAELRHEQRNLGGVPCQVRRHDPLGLPGYDILYPIEQALPVQEWLLAAGARLAGRETYNVLRVEAGTPEYGPDMDENRFVVEVGRTGRAICYTKGCYLGQEPIVMARDRGHVNRTLGGLRLQGDGPAPAGSRVLRGGEEVGHLTSSVVSPRLGPIALGYVRRGHQEPGTAVEVEAGAARRGAEVAPLPFPGSGCAVR